MYLVLVAIRRAGRAALAKTVVLNASRRFRQK